jgi:hypothetical protein
MKTAATAKRMNMDISKNPESQGAPQLCCGLSCLKQQFHSAALSHPSIIKGMSFLILLGAQGT